MLKIKLKKETAFDVPLYCIWSEKFEEYLCNVHGEEIGFLTEKEAEKFLEEERGDIYDHFDDLHK